MSYSAIVVGLGLVSAILAMIGLGVKDREISEERASKMKKHWYYILLDPSMLRLLFITGSIYMLLLIPRFMTYIVDEEKYTEIAPLMDGAHFALMFIMLTFMFLSGLALLANIVELFTKVGEE